ncbi:hypothetical protein IP92_00703 [Pseudoduganella flava]|uniref:Uncharacterized protein n=1 Tax=Pseudoduganella flava TaxID=871742 RepID=A0A562Q4N1_9BURK|nr:hypothetical protein [Pseudoduganella flava]QGZ41719.1 hypothetical protein GO485_23440 [Pseudoduganella flava]TWI51715.1 hypothetical protein IP92_00703 [Pseudoduganella flava]
MKPMLQAMRAAAQWRLLLMWLGCLLLPALLMALPVWLTLAAELDHTVHVAALARALDMVAIADLGSALRRNADALTTGGVGAVVLTLLLSPLLTGAAVTAARAAEPPGWRALVGGACELYPRMLRMLAWGLVPLTALAALGTALADASFEHAREAIVYSAAYPWEVAAAVVAALAMVFANLTLDLGRTVLAVDRRRTHAVPAWWHGLRLLWQRPGGVLLAWLVPTVAGLLLAALLGAARVQVPALGAAGTLGAVLLAQLVVLALGWMRAARLFALIALAQRLDGPPHLH